MRFGQLFVPGSTIWPKCVRQYDSLAEFAEVASSDDAQATGDCGDLRIAYRDGTGMILIASVYHRTNVLHKGQRVLRYPTLTRPGDWKSRQPLRSGPTATEELASKGWLRKPCGHPRSRRSLIAWFQPPDKKWGTASHRVVRAISRWERATAAVARSQREIARTTGSPPNHRGGSTPVKN